MPIPSKSTLPPIHPFIGMSVPHLLKSATAEHEKKLFLTWEPSHGSQKIWTYIDAYNSILGIASGLKSKGVTSGDAIIIHLDNCPESIFCWLACSFIGAVAVTTNTRCSAEELSYFIDKVQAVGMITQPEYKDLLADYPNELNWIIEVEPGSGGESMYGSEELTLPAPDPSAPFCIQFTSGTTSRPKAVLWTHANALWGAMTNARHLGLTHKDVAHIHSPLCHTLAQSWQTLGSIWVGASVVIQPKFSASQFWDVVTRNGCTWTVGGSFVEIALKDTPTPAHHSLRFFIGASHMPAHATEWRTRSWSGLGMTESITQSIYSDLTGPIDEGTLGRPAPEYEIKLLGPEGESVVSGRGELLIKGIRGLSIFSEYFDDEQANLDAFTEDGYFRTGDVIEIGHNGSVTFVERTKDMLKVGGENVAASEIETAIRKVAGVQEVAVVARHHPMLIEIPVAFVIATANAPADLASHIAAQCKKSLADFKQPREIRLVADFPRSMGGAKIAKASLREILKAESDQLK